MKIPIRKSWASIREFVLSFGYHAGDLTQRKELQKADRIIQRQTGRAGAKDRAAEKSEARALSPPSRSVITVSRKITTRISPVRSGVMRISSSIARWPSSSNRDARAAISGQLAGIADHISTTERDAAEAEIDAVKMKKLEFFQLQLDANESAGVSRDRDRRAQLRPAHRTAGRFADRA